MTMLRLLRSLFGLAVLVAAWPSSGLAQERAAAPSLHSPGLAATPYTLETARLTCPECACERARNDTLMVRREYREIHDKVSLRAPRTAMVSGFIAAGAVAGITLVASIFMPLATHDEDPERVQRRVLLTGGLIMTVPLAIGFAGATNVQQRRKDVEPYHERHNELRIAYREAVRAEKKQCRDVPRR